MTEAPAAGTTATAGELQIGDRVTWLAGWNYGEPSKIFKEVASVPALGEVWTVLRAKPLLAAVREHRVVEDDKRVLADINPQCPRARIIGVLQQLERKRGEAGQARDLALSRGERLEGIKFLGGLHLTGVAQVSAHAGSNGTNGPLEPWPAVMSATSYGQVRLDG